MIDIKISMNSVTFFHLNTVNRKGFLSIDVPCAPACDVSVGFITHYLSSINISIGAGTT